ncbi:hypothetical protein LVD17_09595 [Fulvivirga ulvae]|uniref:STAS/SEC14 domain-containing protein n=1 Tax=Fulvivirga ulvae TaxID=2904245 RepID=UPI001F42FC6F|nr:STAS/SEC14 domain-containing protein [Fulvivirga ulvae]UII34066.1 hypothetical protein LVD17_09595 [Fulvivirga ulvae]
MELYFESDYVRICYESSWHYVALQWLTPPTNEEFRDGCERMLAAIKHYGVKKTLVDARQQGAIHPDLIEWMDKVWAAQAIDLGYRHCAVITPTDVFASFALDEITQMSKRTLVKTEYFDKEEKAIEWLKQLSETAKATT